MQQLIPAEGAAAAAKPVHEEVCKSWAEGSRSPVLWCFSRKTFKIASFHTLRAPDCPRRKSLAAKRTRWPRRRRSAMRRSRWRKQRPRPERKPPPRRPSQRERRPPRQWRRPSPSFQRRPACLGRRVIRATNTWRGKASCSRNCSRTARSADRRSDEFVCVQAIQLTAGTHDVYIVSVSAAHRSISSSECVRTAQPNTAMPSSRAIARDC